MESTNGNHRNVRKAARERVLQRFRELKVGDLVSHHQLAEITEFSRVEQPNEYWRAVNWARNTFRDDTGIWLESVRGQGLRYPTGEEQVRTGVSGMRRSVRGLAREAKRVSDVIDDRLPEPARRKRDHVLDRMRYLHELMRTERHAMLAQVGTPEVSPQLPLQPRIA